MKDKRTKQQIWEDKVKACERMSNLEPKEPTKESSWSEEFFQKFADTPIEKRFQIINFAKYGIMTLFNVYERLHSLEARRREIEKKEKEFLEAANIVFNKSKD